MKRRQALLGIVLLAAGVDQLRAQASGKLPRVVVLHAGASSEPASIQREPFERGLRDNGWLPGKSILIDYRYAEGKGERVAELARELAQSDANVILARGNEMVRTAQAAAKNIPIVMLWSGDPVAEGIVKSLARPGANITGVTGDNFALDTKRLELLKEAFPRAKRLAILANPNFEGGQFEERIAVIQARARALKLQAQTFRVSSISEIAAAFSAIAKYKAEALLVRPDPQVIDRSRSEITSLAAKHRLPAVYPWRFFVESGGLMSYSANFTWFHAESAVYVSRILKGEKPAEMAIEQPSKYEMAINPGTARALGIEIPKAVLFRADALIE